MGSVLVREPCLDAAEAVIAVCRWRGQPVLLDQTVKALVAEYGDCGLSTDELSALVSRLVIRNRWCLAA